MQPEEAFGEVLRELRLARQLSQETLALEAGLQRNYVSLLERGKNSASIKTLFKLSPVLHVPVSRMVTEIEARMAAADTENTSRTKRPARR